MIQSVVRLKKGREKPVVSGHPWVFSGAVEGIEPEGAEPGAACRVLAADGSFLANGYVNPRSQIICRLVSRAEAETWSEELVVSRVAEAIRLRERLLPPATDCIRLVNSEGDGLPGVVVDRYGSGVVVELNTAGADRLRGAVTESLERALAGPSFIYENSAGPARGLEHLPEVKQALAGAAPDRIIITEYGHRFLVEPFHGQKTGFYLDQRENRKLAAGWARPGCSALNLFAYTGAFSVYLAAAGAGRVVSVDSSERACVLAVENLILNDLSPEAHPIFCEDAFEYLRNSSGPFDVIVVDPPPLARRSAHVQKAARAYKDVNRLAIAAAASGGAILTFSCSAHVDIRLFSQIVFSAALEAGRRVRILARLGAGPDHPVSIFHPEGEYLKGLLLEVD
ncbi:MAG: class I SAM-dependent rRNA methyltransferase [Candidatus Glassbacteria bacterium]